jgi:hypothetical protein
MDIPIPFKADFFFTGVVGFDVSSGVCSVFFCIGAVSAFGVASDLFTSVCEVFDSEAVFSIGFIELFFYAADVGFS